MHVLIVSNGIPTIQYPLTGIFGFDQARALQKSGVHVTYFGVDLRSIRRVRRWGIISGERDGVKWHVINYPVGRVPTEILIGIGKIGIRKLYSEFIDKDNVPNIIHAHFAKMGIVAADIARKKDIPLVLTEHSSEMNSKNISPSLLKLARRAYRDSDKLLTVSTPLKDNIMKNTGIESTVVPNVLNDEMFFGVEREVHDGFGFVYTGGLTYRKRPNMLVDVFSKVHARYPDTFLGIIGDGDYKNEIEALIKIHSLEKYVKIYGLKTRKEIAQIYRKYDCFVMPSSMETFGVVYIEAMAAGLPVIATRCGGPEDFVNERNGVLVDVDDKDQLFKAMCHVYECKNDYLSSDISQYASSNFSEQVIANRLIDEYKMVLNEEK